MKTSNYLELAFSLFFVIFLSNTGASAESTDPDRPTVLAQNVIQGKNSGEGETVFFYHSFTAGPGVLKITTDITSENYYGSTINWKLTDGNFNELGSDSLHGEKTGGRKVTEVKLNKKQKVILKVEVEHKTANYKIQFAGAVDFPTGKSSGNIPEITGDNASQTSEQVCMPRNGTLILTMQDGKKAKLDLSKVQKIDIQ